MPYSIFSHSSDGFQMETDTVGGPASNPCTKWHPSLQPNMKSRGEGFSFSQSWCPNLQIFVFFFSVKFSTVADCGMFWYRYLGTNSHISPPKLGGGVKYFLFASLFGEDSHFDEYFSIGLKPPTSKVFV